MRMVRAIIRPERETAVAAALAGGGFPAMTKWDVLGRGQQQGVQVGDKVYNEMGKTMVMVVVEDEDEDGVAKVIQEAAATGYPGDGKTFVTPVEAAYTLRTGASGL